MHLVLLSSTTLIFIRFERHIKILFDENEDKVNTFSHV